MIKIQNLAKSFGDVKVFENLNLDIAENQVNCIMARSGAGKSTLINIILGFLKQDSGEILNIPSNISVVFQEDRLVENVSCLKNIIIQMVRKKAKRHKNYF